MSEQYKNPLENYEPTPALIQLVELFKKLDQRGQNTVLALAVCQAKLCAK